MSITINRPALLVWGCGLRCRAYKLPQEKSPCLLFNILRQDENETVHPHIHLRNLVYTRLRLFLLLRMNKLILNKTSCLSIFFKKLHAEITMPVSREMKRHTCTTHHKHENKIPRGMPSGFQRAPIDKQSWEKRRRLTPRFTFLLVFLPFCCQHWCHKR